MGILEELQEALEIVNGKTDNNEENTNQEQEEIVQVTNTTSLKIKSGSGC